MRRTVVAIAILALVLASGCSAPTPSPGPTGAATSPSPSATATKKKARVPRARFAAYATEEGLFVYDVKEDLVRRVATGASLRLPKWLSRDEISFVQDGRTSQRSTLRVLDMRTGGIRDVLTVTTGIRAYGWSPDREIVAYVTVNAQSYPKIQYQILQGEGAPKPVATLARALGREYTPGDQERMEFSPDGQSVLVVYTPADGDFETRTTPEQSQLQVRTVDGTLAHAADHDDDPTMGLWSADGTKVFYRSGNRVRAWVVATSRVESVPGGVAWSNPWRSPDGRLVAYDTGATGPRVRVRTLDLRTGATVSVSGAGRYRPVFASTRTIWTQRIVKCEQEDCLEPVVPTNEVFAIDVKDGKETRIALPTLHGVDVFYS